MDGFENSIIARAQGDFVTGPDDGFRTEEEIAADLAKPGHPSTDAGHEAQSSVPPSEQKVPSYHDDGPAGHDPHAYVGISLIAGFILMYLIDTLPRRASSSSQPQRFQVNLTQFSLNRASTSSPDLESPQQDGDYHAKSNSASSSRPSSTTVGLVIHACADGIALGASSTSGSSSSGRNLSLIIFLALMIHKAPAAFGLTTTLLKQGLSKRAARAHLVVFSLAAPAGALLTWAAASLLGYGGPESMSAEFATGVLLLFSGGTFLYVAMHTMQEGAGHAQHAGNGYAEVPMNGYGESGSGGGAQGKDAGEHGVAETFVTVVGMLLPLLTQFGHAH
jgi:zinc transporter 9